MGGYWYMTPCESIYGTTPPVWWYLPGKPGDCVTIGRHTSATWKILHSNVSRSHGILQVVIQQDRPVLQYTDSSSTGTRTSSCTSLASPTTQRLTKGQSITFEPDASAAYQLWFGEYGPFQVHWAPMTCMITCMTAAAADLAQARQLVCQCGGDIVGEWSPGVSHVVVGLSELPGVSMKLAQAVASGTPIVTTSWLRAVHERVQAGVSEHAPPDTAAAAPAYAGHLVPGDQPAQRQTLRDVCVVIPHTGMEPGLPTLVQLLGGTCISLHAMPDIAAIAAGLQHEKPHILVLPDVDQQAAGLPAGSSVLHPEESAVLQSQWGGEVLERVQQVLRAGARAMPLSALVRCAAKLQPAWAAASPRATPVHAECPVEQADYEQSTQTHAWSHDTQSQVLPSASDTLRDSATQGALAIAAAVPAQGTAATRWIQCHSPAADEHVICESQLEALEIAGEAIDASESDGQVADTASTARAARAAGRGTRRKPSSKKLTATAAREAAAVAEAAVQLELGEAAESSDAESDSECDAWPGVAAITVLSSWAPNTELGARLQARFTYYEDELADRASVGADTTAARSGQKRFRKQQIRASSWTPQYSWSTLGPAEATAAHAASEESDASVQEQAEHAQWERQALSRPGRGGAGSKRAASSRGARASSRSRGVAKQPKQPEAERAAASTPSPAQHEPPAVAAGVAFGDLLDDLSD